MLIQRAGSGTIPPSVGGFASPCWESLVEAWDAAPVPSCDTVALGPATVELGHDDPEEDDSSLDVKDHELGWDNEHPRREVEVAEFRIEWRPITNGQFYEYWKSAKGKVPMPKLWMIRDGQVLVRNWLSRHYSLCLIVETHCERIGPYLFRTSSDEDSSPLARHRRLQ
jgi:formylglycine-generating enzyme required for sulfatase activity